VPSHFKVTEENLKCVVFPVIIIWKFTHNRRSLSEPHAQIMEQLHVFEAWHHNWKFWGQNHNIYSDYTSVTFYTLCRYMGFYGTACEIQLSLLLPVIQFWVIHLKTLPSTKSNVAFSAVHFSAFLHSFPVWRLLLSVHTWCKHWDFSTSLACVTEILSASLVAWP
jgi:hypothetical protein